MITHPETKTNQKMKQTKERDSNFELLRIVAMLLVLLVHANYFSLGDVTRDEIISTPW